MIIGNKEEFAIEFEIIDVLEKWVFGKFRIWVTGVTIGNFEDESVDLKGCINWFSELVQNSVDRYEPGLFHLEKDEVFSRLCIVLTSSSGDASNESYLNSYFRFHVSHIGMSAFDNVTIVMIESGSGLARFVWQQNNSKVDDGIVPTAKVKEVAKAFLVAFKKAMIEST